MPGTKKELMTEQTIVRLDLQVVAVDVVVEADAVCSCVAKRIETGTETVKEKEWREWNRNRGALKYLLGKMDS